VDTVKSVVLGLLVAVAAGCAGPRAGMLLPDGSTTHVIGARVEWIDSERRAVPPPSTAKELLLVFSPISGQIDGFYASPPLQTVHARPAGRFLLDLRMMTGKIDAASTTLVKNGFTRGLVMTPQETRFARVATQARDAATDKGIGATVFLEPTSRDYLVMVFVDRSCAYTGTVRIGNDIVEYDVRLEHGGFHWLRYYRREAGGGFLVKVHPAGGEISFAILVDESL
jgi:hypothetical protein